MLAIFKLSFKGFSLCHLILHGVGLTAQVITVMTLVLGAKQICSKAASDEKCRSWEDSVRIVAFNFIY